MTRLYHGSKGPQVIADMPTNYLRNATLKRERDEPGAPQTLALRAELDRREERIERIRREMPEGCC
jgi:hypothetical protein